MSEVPTEEPHSPMLRATLQTMKVRRAFRHIVKSAELELVDVELDPAGVTPQKSAELALLAQEILDFMKDGSSILKDIVETGAVAVEENGGGLPLRISPIGKLPAIGTGEPAETPPLPPAPPHGPEAAAGSSGEAAENIRPVNVQIGETFYDNAALDINNAREIELLQLLPRLEGRAITRRLIMELGFYSDAETPAAITQAYAKAIKSVTAKLEKAAGQAVVERQGTKGRTRYVVKMGMTVDGQEVAVTTAAESVKKN